MKSPFVKFLVSRVFWKNVLYASLITVGLVVLVQISLHIYTAHGKKIQVPDLTGLSLEQADKLCALNSLSCLIQDSNYVKQSPPGSILDQYPAPGSFVKENRKVYLVTNSWFPELIKMPKAYDMPYRQAERVLQSAGLYVEATEYVPFFARTYVLEQKLNGTPILEGTLLEEGSGITLVLGGGLSNERSQVPRLLNLTREEAMQTALVNYFNLGAVKFDLSVLSAEDSALARVYRQFPDYDNIAQLGFTIDIWLTADPVRLYDLDSIQNTDLISPDSIQLQ